MSGPIIGGARWGAAHRVPSRPSVRGSYAWPSSHHSRPPLGTVCRCSREGHIGLEVRRVLLGGRSTGAVECQEKRRRTEDRVSQDHVHAPLRNGAWGCPEADGGQRGIERPVVERLGESPQVQAGARKTITTPSPGLRTLTCVLPHGGEIWVLRDPRRRLSPGTRTNRRPPRPAQGLWWGERSPSICNA